MEDYLQYLLYALIIVLLVAAGWGGKALLKIAETFLKNKIGAQNFEMLKNFATIAVRAIEQSPEFKELVGQDKKSIAITMIFDFAQSNNLPVSIDLVECLVEAAVQIMNGEKPDIAEFAEVVGIK